MSTQQSDVHSVNQDLFDFNMATTSSFAPINYSFDPNAATSSMNFDPNAATNRFEDGPIMWGGMQQLSLDKSSQQQPQYQQHKWPQDPMQSIHNQAAAHHISQYGQITPPNDTESPFVNSVKQEDEVSVNAYMGPGQPQELPPAPSTRPKRNASKRKTSKDKDLEAAEPKKKSTRKARKGYKATTKEEENDSDGEVKRERFLERNRVAASKCRMKKKEWTNGLEGHARDLAATNAHLNAVALQLKEEVLMLKSECLKHTDCNCTRIREYLDRSIAGMHPSGALNMLPNAQQSSMMRKPSDESTYTFDTNDFEMSAASVTSGSRHGSTSAESQASARSSKAQVKSEREMQALLEASIATPDNGVGQQMAVG